MSELHSEYGTRMQKDLSDDQSTGTLVLALPDGSERRWNIKDVIPTEMQNMIDGIKM